MPTIIMPFEDWALSHEQKFALEPLLAYGERCLIKLVYKLDDLKAGRTTRCTHSAAGDDLGVQERVAEVYKQAGDSHCPICYGTGYTGGFQPETYISYMLAQTADQQRDYGRSGITQEVRPEVQLPAFPSMETGDMVVRVSLWDTDGITPITIEQRYECGTVHHQTIRAGLAMGRDEELMVAQVTALRNLPPEHPYYTVPLV